ncbi:MAG: Bifunctional protein GlmU [Promethearchaeota archaeon]|nr:MAG: Bifunctional protein GlmU [Candidatus Lokiarchaeota archaeon]
MENHEWCAVVPAGGRGTRLRPLTSEIPKPLVKVCNVPLIDFAISHLIHAGIKHIIISLAHQGELIEKHINKTWTPDKLGDVKLESYIVDSKGNADAYRMMIDLVDAKKIVVSMSDVITNLPLKKLMDFHSNKQGIATISMKTVESNISQYGVVLIDKNHRIYLFLEKPAPMELYVSSIAQKADLYLHTNIINTGIYAFKKEIDDILEETGLNDFGGEIFPYLLDNDYKMYGFIENYYWMDCGNPTTYKWANWDLLRKYAWPITPNGKEYDGVFVMGVINSGENVIIDKPSCFGEYVELHDQVKIRELTTIGNHVEIGKGSEIKKSVIWDNVKIGDGCKITDSIICNDCKIEDNVILNDATIAPRCTISSNTNLSGKSLDLGQSI